MGFELRLFDDDVVSEENVATQFHSRQYIDVSKARSLSREIKFDIGYVPEFYDMRVDQDTDPLLVANDIIISAVDSIEARQEIWPVVREAGPFWYIDLRMAAEAFTAYSVYATHFNWYEEVLYSQDGENVPPLACTEKATFYTALFAGGWAGLILRRIITKQPVPIMISHDILNMKAVTMAAPRLGTETE